MKDYIKIYGFFYKMSGKNHLRTIKRIIDSSIMILKMFACQTFIDIQCIEVRKHVYDIQYQIHLKQYKIRVHHKKGPPIYKHFYDQDLNDISLEILPYIGPNHDFHGISYTPNDFGYSNISVEYSNGIIISFEKDQVIGEKECYDLIK